MNNMEAAIINTASPDGHEKAFDWDKAATILKEKNPDIALAGLEGDFDNTGGAIWANGKPVIDGYTYLASCWATPILVIDGDEIPCYVSKNESDFDPYTKWPESALKIIEGEKGQEVTAE